MIKRQIYGRAGFPLRKRVILHPGNAVTESAPEPEMCARTTNLARDAVRFARSDSSQSLSFLPA